jgi:prophage tail gpP-like protein
MTTPQHRVDVRIGSKVVQGWTTYSVDTDMLQPADAFSLTFGKASRALYELCRPDEAAQIILDEATILTGYIDERSFRSDRSGTNIGISGRDKGGRLCDESMELFTFDGLGIQDLAERCVEDWFPQVSFRNTENRRLTRGPHAKTAKTSGEPAIVQSGRAAKKVRPGESRWQVLENFLEKSELLAWSSADGQSFIVGLPNYAQAPQYRFFHAAETSDRHGESNVLSCEITDTLAERYSRITAIGASRGNKATYGDRLKQKGVVRNNPETVFGTGRDFIWPKRLILADDDVRDRSLADKRAAREMAYRDSTGHRITLSVRGHSQIYGGLPVLYAFDTMAEFEDEVTGVKGRYLLVSVRFTRNRNQGEVTTITLVPEGTILKA